MTGTILDKFSTQTADKTAPVKEGPVSVLLSDRQASFVSNSSEKNNVLFYEKNTGKIFELNIEDKTERVISDKNVSDLLSVIWSPTKKEVLNFLNPPTGKLLKHSKLGGSLTDLGSNIHSAAFSPDGNLIAYYYRDDSQDSGKIVISQPDGMYQKKIFNTRLENIEVSWPDKDRVALKTGHSVYILTTEGGFNKLTESGLGFEEKWSPGGKKMLFSFFSGDIQDPKMMLGLKKAETGDEIISELMGSARKCAWSVDDVNIYCIIPDTPSEDVIYKINTDDWKLKIAAEPKALVKELLLSNLEDNIIFVGESDNKLYSIKIVD
jgi:hypothetical protein